MSYVKFSFSYSNLRGELYVYNWKGDMVFSVQECEMPEGAEVDFSQMDSEDINNWLLHNYAEEIDALCSYDPEETRRYGAGKFDTMLDSFVFNLYSGECDEELGDVDESFGWHGLLLNLDADEMVKAVDRIGDGESMTGGEHAFISRNPHAILFENGDGFVSVTYYKTAENAQKAWYKLECRYEEWCKGE